MLTNRHTLGITVKRYAADFPSRLTDFAFETLENDPHSIFALSPTLQLIYMNPAYVEFARANGGDAAFARYPIGASFVDALEGVVKDYVAGQFRSALTDGKAWYHEYQCSSAERYREFHQGVYPLKNNGGLVVINSLKVDAPMERDRVAPHVAAYTTMHGLLSQCSNCRRTRRSDDPSVWDWVPEWVTNPPPNTSHSICPTCYDYYWQE